MNRGIPGPGSSYPARLDRPRSNQYQASDSSQHTWSSGTSPNVSSSGYQFGQGPTDLRSNNPSNRPANPMISASIPTSTPTPVGSGINISHIFAQVERAIGDPRQFPLIDAFLRGEEQSFGVNVSFTIERSGWISNLAESPADLSSPRTATPDSSSSSVSSVELPPLSIPLSFGESSDTLNIILVVLTSTIAAPVASGTQPSYYNGPHTRTQTRGGSLGQPQVRHRDEVRDTSSFQTHKRCWMLFADLSRFWQQN